jgi:hypothetical protein
MMVVYAHEMLWVLLDILVLVLIVIGIQKVITNAVVMRRKSYTAKVLKKIEALGISCFADLLPDINKCLKECVDILSKINEENTSEEDDEDDEDSDDPDVDDFLD